ncbi:hypothetical protein [Actinomadura rupiterrae]|uniref:hypothetical protein n=1 Tax=Actinomadura rupiterrae TaxID=559627 RepID=UPI0020A4F3B7|nr:hypothetical protein [Actinomadura rupiterrae]MCP2336818.1 hypothetical protein [Actinomadura rupiterrae]
MPKAPHEAQHRIMRRDPDLIHRLVGRDHKTGFTLRPYKSYKILDSDLTQGEPLERRVDTLIGFEGEDGAPFIVICEAQSKTDPNKLHSWPYYVAFVRAKYKIEDVYLLVACRDEETAKWARIGSVTGWSAVGKKYFVTQSTRPYVLGPTKVPEITDAGEAAEDIILAVFAAITHALSPQVGAILEALADALATQDTESAQFFAQYLNVALEDTDAQAIWRELMALKDHPYANELRDLFEEPARKEGLAEGKRKTTIEHILTALRSRGIPTSSHDIAKIKACTDETTLDTWFTRSMSATTIKDVFRD